MANRYKADFRKCDVVAVTWRGLGCECVRQGASWLLLALCPLPTTENVTAAPGDFRVNCLYFKNSNRQTLQLRKRGQQSAQVSSLVGEGAKARLAARWAGPGMASNTCILLKQLPYARAPAPTGSASGGGGAPRGATPLRAAPRCCTSCAPPVCELGRQAGGGGWNWDQAGSNLCFC